MYDELQHKPGLLLDGMNTEPLQQGDAPTRVLVALNPRNAPYSGLVRFAAAFPQRLTIGRRPVVVRDLSGNVVPSRLTKEEWEAAPNLPLDRILWRLELEFLTADIPAQGWRAYSAVFEHSSESRSDDTAFWQAQTPFSSEIRVLETDCHDGDLPLIGRFTDLTDFPFAASSA